MLILPSSPFYLIFSFCFILRSITQLVLTVRSVQEVTIVLMVFQRELLMAVYVSPSP